MSSSRKTGVKLKKAARAGAAKKKVSRNSMNDKSATNASSRRERQGREPLA